MSYKFIGFVLFVSLIVGAIARPLLAATVELEDGTIVEITVLDGRAASVEAAECSAETPTACALGGIKYCTYSQDKQDREGGFSFETSTFLSACDTNADGRYTYCLDYVPHADGGFSFGDSSYYRYCGEDPEWNPTPRRVKPE